MIKIGPLLATDYGHISALLDYQQEQAFELSPLTQSGLMLRSLAFWQHWLPCQYHVTASVYVAREESNIVGFICLNNVGKSKLTWRIDHLVVHPDHRGRGIAQELLRYVFALFGSQGVSHFIAEVPNFNDAALSLFATCGFCRSARVTYYKLPQSDRKQDQVEVDEEFRLATFSQKQALFQLHQDVLPPDLRLVLGQTPADFSVNEQLPYTSVERTKQRLMRKRVWYWIAVDPDRRVATAAVKVIAEPELGYRLDFAVHPGWRHLATGVVNHAVNNLLKDVPELPVWARVYDFQDDIGAALRARSFERTGEFFILAREHWQRSKRPKKRKVDATVPLSQIAKPAINLPLATERHSNSW